MTEQKPRELWISKRANEMLFMDYCIGSNTYAFNYEPSLVDICAKEGDIVHMVEASALDAAKAEIEQLKSLMSVQLDMHDKLKDADKEIEMLRKVVVIYEKVLFENCCYDDCGFDPEMESKETLVAVFKNNDQTARQALQQTKELMGEK